MHTAEEVKRAEDLFAALERFAVTVPSDSTLRRRARAKGLRLVKVRENSRWYYTHGPYMVTSNGYAIEYGLSELDAEIAIREYGRECYRCRRENPSDEGFMPTYWHAVDEDGPTVIVCPDCL